MLNECCFKTFFGNLLIRTLKHVVSRTRKKLNPQRLSSLQQSTAKIECKKSDYYARTGYINN